MREHIRPDVRIHYVITEGGVAPNIVPDKASVWYFVRALKMDTVEETAERLIQAAKGAAMMTDTELHIERLGGCYPMMGNHVLADVLEQALCLVGQEEWTAQEKDFAKALNQKSEKQWLRAVKEYGLTEDTQLFTGVAPVAEETTFDSTDVGDVAHLVPTGFFTTATSSLGAPGHSWQVTACSGCSIGEKGMLYGAKAMAAAGLGLFLDETLRAHAKNEFDAELNGEEYRCPVPEESPWHR